MANIFTGDFKLINVSYNIREKGREFWESHEEGNFIWEFLENRKPVFSHETPAYEGILTEKRRRIYREDRICFLFIR